MANDGRRDASPVEEGGSPAVTVARFAVFVLPLGLFFTAAAAPSQARAVLSTASALTIGSGLGLWPAGRLLDRIGRWRGLRLSMLIGSASLVVLALAVGGASGIEAASIEVALILAPVAGALLGQWGPAVTPAAAAALLLASAVLLPAHTDARRPASIGHPLLSRSVTALAGLALLLGLSGGLMEPGLATLPSRLPDDTAGNAVLFVALAVGSAAGGLLAARTTWPNRPVHSIPLFTLHAVALFGAATTRGLLQLGLLVVAGLPIAALQSLAGLHLDRVAGPMRASERFGLVAAILTLATGVGQAIAAQTTGQLDPHHLILLAATPPLLAAILVAVRHTQRP
jgi:hypothetical protein